MKNGVMLQAFEWNTEGGGTFYDRIRNQNQLIKEKT